MPPEELTDDEVFRLLSSEYRRVTLAALLEANESQRLDDLAERVADEVGGDEDLVTVELYHAHIPKMDGFGVIEYDERRRTVEPTEQITEVEPYLG